ncbi:SPRY-domain-containing protein [Basidiobolus meristosporus CBS 931.73]|uniref:SPRY-domain-containing protein n=1 Tax=Basidiobolus meristosporus CBS 931.73 TaxID=1314790 RepID=A0A1Y1Z5I3_9FUNG|nr:SPRY-domain-containing protein [Basidiobolus meristosporus CBS 931.73]|eukprot:ORY05510.1 SPRY-domain-containing protein [Basidiobolus meristosporus CBS 931.73]
MFCRGPAFKAFLRSFTYDSEETERLLTDATFDNLNPELLSELERQSFELSRAFETTYPPGSIPTELTYEQTTVIREKGVGAWEFVADSDVNVIVQDRTEVSFYGGEYCVQTNLPLPRRESVYYFEVKVFEKAPQTRIGIGLSTKPYPSWRFPGRNRHSVGYHSNGRKYCNDPLNGKPYGVPFYKGDVIGCGFRTQSGTIFFTRNGVRLGSAVTGAHLNFFPTIAADGPCILHVNLGQMGFVFIEANVKKWGLAPSVGSISPPPAYGTEKNSVLLESGSVFTEAELASIRTNIHSNPDLRRSMFKDTPCINNNQQPASYGSIDTTQPKNCVSISIGGLTPPPAYSFGECSRAIEGLSQSGAGSSAENSPDRAV